MTTASATNHGLMIRGAANSTRVEAATDDAAFIARPPRG